MDEKLHGLLVGVRKVLLELIAHLEDYLNVPYDKSGLYKRRQKVSNG